jgi:cobyrinic acid a,c-diamide synthase
VVNEENHSHVTALDSSYKLIHQSSLTYDVHAPADGVQIASPIAGHTFDKTTVHVGAKATESAKVSQMQVWDNGVKLGWYTGSSVNQYFDLTTANTMCCIGRACRTLGAITRRRVLAGFLLISIAPAFSASISLISSKLLR